MKVTTQIIANALVAATAISVGTAGMPAVASAAVPSAGYMLPSNCTADKIAVANAETGIVTNEGYAICTAGNGYYRVVVKLYDPNTNKLARVHYGPSKMVGSNERSTVAFPDGYNVAVTLERNTVPFPVF